jgi:hypothetical protein
MIQDQVKLSAKVALNVVLQGIRIRLGRSIVTITGVVCGIAFLMSILTGQMIKKGVKEEDAVRAEVTRIVNFTEAEIGFLKDRQISIIVTGVLADREMRVLEAYEKKEATIEFLDRPVLLRKLKTATEADSTNFGRESIGVIHMGDGALPNLDWPAVLNRGKQKPFASLQIGMKVNGLDKGQIISLSRELTEDEIAKKAKELKKDKFRTVWIGVISLLVTVIGITNAMLMSVTERFREIGTMKCLGALSAFIRQIFIIESSMMGLTGGFIGVIAGGIFSLLMYSKIYGFSKVWTSIDFPELLLYGVISLLVGLILSVVAALYPARVASKMVPADALRSNV